MPSSRSGLHVRLILNHKPVFPVGAARQLPLGGQIPLLNIPGLAAAHDLSGTGNVDFIIREIDLNGMHVKIPAKVNLQPFRPICG